jgi:hypothetical protein
MALLDLRLDMPSIKAILCGCFLRRRLFQVSNWAAGFTCHYSCLGLQVNRDRLSGEIYAVLGKLAGNGASRTWEKKIYLVPQRRMQVNSNSSMCIGREMKPAYILSPYPEIDLSDVSLSGRQ